MAEFQSRPMARPAASVGTLFEGIKTGKRASLARAITLVESKRTDDEILAQNLLDRILPLTGRSVRIGITGVPGVGKSAFVEALGSRLTASGHRVAVLSIDPSSTRSRGSVLGDKARMTKLSADPHAFIRPSPSGNVLGGIARKTRETMLLCEAAGYDVVLVETVGVGQSEVAVSAMTDLLLVLMLAGAGDELQGIKRGLLELADLIVITKADGANVINASRAAAQLRFAMHLLHGAEGAPEVLTCSAVEMTGIDAVWTMVQERLRAAERSGARDRKRASQAAAWMWTLVDEKIQENLRTGVTVRHIAEEAENRVRSGSLSPAQGADAIIGALRMAVSGQQ
jgi:LAO/AO transport system kinase